MIFLLRILAFSFLIFFGFRISLRSKKGRSVVSAVYGFVLIFYTFLIRVKITVDVVASDYGHTAVTLTTGEKIWNVLRAIFGMQANGNLAGNYREAFVLNVLLMIPLGYLVLLHFLCGDSSVLGSPQETAARDVITDGDSSGVKEEATYQSRRAVKTIALRSLVICVATSLAIEVTQEITKLGMFDTNDIIANSIGSCIGIGMVWLWQHVVHPLDDSAVRCGGDITMRCTEGAVQQ